MPKQIDVKVTKAQKKHGHGSTRKYPIHTNVTCADPRFDVLLSAMHKSNQQNSDRNQSKQSFFDW